MRFHAQKNQAPTGVYLKMAQWQKISGSVYKYNMV